MNVFKLNLICLVTVCLIGSSAMGIFEQETEILPEEDYLEQARSYLASNLYEKSINNYEELQTFYPFGDKADTARLEVIYAYYITHDYQNALVGIQRYKNLHPKSNRMDYLLYVQGLAESRMLLDKFKNIIWADLSRRDLSDIKKAFSTYKQLIEDYPQSVYVPSAYRKAQNIRLLIAKSEIYTAQFYLGVGANLAAIERSSEYLNHFYGLPQTSTAFSILSEAFTQLGLDEVAKDVEHVDQLNQL